MDRLRRVISNTVISLLGQVVTWTSTLLLTVAYGRFLGDVKFGELYFALAFVVLFGVPLEFGFNQQLTRDVAQKPDKALRYLSNTLLIKGLLWLILYGLILLVCWLLGYNAEVRSLVAINGFTLLFASITNAFKALHYAFERVVFPVIGTILEKGLAALIGIILLRNGAGVQVMAFVLLGGAIANGLWQALWFFHLTGVSFAIERALIRELIRTSIPFMLYGALAVIYYRIDAVLLSLMTNVAVVGWYGAAYRLFDTLNFLPTLVVGAILYPVFSKLSVSSETNLKLAIEKSMNFLLFCSLPISIGLFVAAPNIIAFLYHRVEFSHSIPVLQALAPGLVFLYINTVFSTTIISTKREKKIAIMAAVALVFNLGLNLVLIPSYQHIGAAAVTSLTELLLLCLSVIFMPKHLLPLGSLRVAVKAAIASFVMALAVLSLTWLHIYNIFVILSVATLIYLSIATLIGTIPREDMRALLTAMRSKVDLPPARPLDSQEERVQGWQTEDNSRSITLPSSMQRISPTQSPQGESAELSMQEAPYSSNGTGTSLPAVTHAELELQAEDMAEFIDEQALTEPQLNVPWWLYPNRYHQ